LESFYRKQAKTLRPKSLDKLRLVIDRFSGWCKRNGIVYMDEVRAGAVGDYYDWELADYEQRGKTIAPQTLKAYLSLLGKCWSQAIRLEQYHGQNPIRAVCHDLPSSDITSRPECLTPEEIAALMEAIAYRKARPFERGPSCRLPQWVEDIVVVMLNTGLRINAAVHLRFDWITGEKLTVPVEYSKSKKVYSTLVNTKVRAIVERRRVELGPDAERVFPEPKGPAWVYSRLNYLAKSLVKSKKWKRDMGHYNHVLRHTFITENLKAGVPLVMVSKLAGHTSVAMTQRYDQTTHNDAIRWALEKGVSL
jgi:integrase